MKVLLCKVGGLRETLSILPTLEAISCGQEVEEVTVLCTMPLAGLVTQTVPGVRVVPVDRDAFRTATGFPFLVSLLRQIGRVDVALVPPEENTLVHLLARMVAPRRIGFAHGNRKAEFFLTEVLPYDSRRSAPCQILDLARHLIDWPMMPLERLPLMTCPSFPSTRPYGVIHPGASHPQQRWDQQRFASLHQALASTETTRGLDWKLINPTDYETIVDLASVLSEASLFVGCHSGPLQMAAQMGIPWVALCGPTDPRWDPPWEDVPGKALRLGPSCQPCGRNGELSTTCQHDMACLQAIEVQHVVSAIEDILSIAPCYQDDFSTVHKTMGMA